jgi:hypothetical protein
VALDDQYANKFALLDSTAIYPKPAHKLLYTPTTGEMKCPIGRDETQIGYGWISLILHLFLYFYPDSNSNTDSVNHVG